MTKQLSRREFIKLTSGSTAALVVGIALPGCAGKPEPRGEAFVPNAYLRIDASDTITIVMPRSEMGQKLTTALPQIVAEELEADWTKIRVVQGDLNPVYGNQTTGGSASIRTQFQRLREAGASARVVLEHAAAEIWQVPAEECRGEKGFVVHEPSQRRLSYGELAATAATLPVPKDVPLKDPREFRIIGQALRGVDTMDKLTGETRYGYDFTLPGMLTAVVARIPTYGGGVETFDAEETLGVPGVKQVVEISSGVAVVAENTWAALEGRRALKVTWKPGPHEDLNSETISSKLHEALDHPFETLRNDGRTQGALEQSNDAIDVVFEVPYLDHAPQEPNNCTAHVHDGKCEVWAPTQNPGSAFQATSQITGFPDDQIIIHTLRMGGGFGRRLQADYVADAVQVAMQVDAPVKVVRMRREDLRNGIYRPTSVHRLRAAVAADGSAQAWDHCVAGPSTGWHGLYSGGAAELAYDIPNVNVRVAGVDFPVPTGAMRSVGHMQNGFVNECGIDMLAHKAGQDPVEFRRRHLRHSPRHLGVLNLAAEKAEWGKSLTAGHAHGVAVHFSYHSYCAIVAEVIRDEEGHYRPVRMTAAMDCGTVINPDGVRAQLEGGITLALTAALYGKITIEDGQVEQSNFHNYPLLKMRDMPIIDTHIVPSTEPPTGAGEPPVPPTAPALINAIASLTGEWITRLPLADHYR